MQFLKEISNKVIDKEYDNNSFQQDWNKLIDPTTVVKIEEDIDINNLKYPNMLDIKKI